MSVLTLERGAGHPLGRQQGITQVLGQRHGAQLSFGQACELDPQTLQLAKLALNLRAALFLLLRILDQVTSRRKTSLFPFSH